MSKIRPLGSRVLIKRTKKATSKGGILLPDSAQEKPKEGTVIAVGEGKVNDEGKNEQLNVQINDRVLFSSYAGTEVKQENNEDNEYIIMNVDDILGVLN